MTDFSKLSDRELDLRCAEFMGYPPKPRAGIDWYMSHHCGESGYAPHLGDTCPRCHGVSLEIQEEIERAEKWSHIPAWASDLNTARELEAEIERRGLVREYETALLNIASHIESTGHFAWFPAITATARQRAEAFAATMQAAGEPR